MVRQSVAVVAIAIGATVVFAAPVSQMYERSTELDSHQTARDNGLELLPRSSLDDLISRRAFSTTEELEKRGLFDKPSRAEAEQGLKWVEKLRSLKKDPTETFKYPVGAGWVELLDPKELEEVSGIGLPKCGFRTCRGTRPGRKAGTYIYDDYFARFDCTYTINNKEDTHWTSVTVGDKMPNWKQIVDKVEEFFKNIAPPP